MANKYRKRCSIQLIIREMQMKTRMTCSLTTVRMAIIKKRRDTWWQGCREKGTLVYWSVGMQVSVAKMENSMAVSQKTKNRPTKWPSNPISGYIFKRNEKRIWKSYLHYSIIIALFAIAKIWKKSVSVNERMNKEDIQ